MDIVIIMILLVANDMAELILHKRPSQGLTFEVIHVILSKLTFSKLNIHYRRTPYALQYH